MSFRIQLKSKVLFHNDIVIERPSYMSEEELRAHIKDAEKALGNSYSFQQFLIKLEDMGFNVVETISDFVTKKDQADASVVHMFEVKDDASEKFI